MTEVDKEQISQELFRTKDYQSVLDVLSPSDYLVRLFNQRTAS